MMTMVTWGRAHDDNGQVIFKGEKHRILNICEFQEYLCEFFFSFDYQNILLYVTK